MNTSRTKQRAEGSGGAWRLNPLDMLMSSGIGKALTKLGIVPRPESSESLLDLAGAILSLRGRASGPALASAFFDLYEASDLADRHAFLARVHDLHPRNREAIDSAIAQWLERRDEASAHALNEATESRTQRLIRILNLAPQGTQRLIAMRSDLLSAPERTTSLKILDKEMEAAFASWFNAGFLELRKIGWDSPARLLERIIRYEAVHSIDGWEDLRRRVEPADRRCYGFFHPQMADDPLIFVEVALTRQLPDSIGSIIGPEREETGAREASHAIFYSISNCQEGLRGIPFGNFLIKRVVGLLQEELPHLSTFATLSPVPRFAKWLAGERGAEAGPPEGEELRREAARYLVGARSGSGLPHDPVARFHLGNGARLEAIHAEADRSQNGIKQSHGIMVNYVYDLADIEANHFALTELGTVVASKDVMELAEGSQPREGKKRNRAA